MKLKEENHLDPSVDRKSKLADRESIYIYTYWIILLGSPPIKNLTLGEILSLESSKDSIEAKLEVQFKR